MATLVEVGDAARRFQLGDLTVIGRDESSAICLADPMVALKHAEIRRDERGRYVLVDLGTRRGTYHREKRISSAVLEPGDEILVGPVRLRFEEAHAAEPRAAAPVQTRAPADTDELRDENQRLRAAVELSQALGDARDLPSLLDIVLDTALRLVGADRGAVAIFAPGSAQPRVKIGRKHDGTPIEVTLSTSLMSDVIARRQGVITWDSLAGDERVNRAASLLAQQVRSALVVPMLHRDELVGIIHLDSQLLNSAFQNKDLELIAAIASQAAAAVKNALLADEVRRASALEQARLARLVGDLPDGVILLDEAQRITLANPRGVALLAALGAGPGAIGQPVEKLGELLVGNLAGQGPAELLVAGPPRRALTVSAHQSINGKASETVLVLRDVTEEREREARTAQQSRLALIGQLAGGVAHDFNNLLAVIVTAGDFVREQVTEPAMLQDLDHILEAARRAAELVKQLLTLGSGQRVRLRAVKIEAALLEMEKLLKRTLPERVRVRANPAPQLWLAKVDPTGLEQVLLNLAVNARDAMPAGGLLTLSANNCALDDAAARGEGVAAGRYVELLVADTGSGMSREVAARIFEPFFTTKEVGKGTGLGLATAYGIAQAAGGSISVRSTPGEGSTFRLLLPATDVAQVSAADPSFAPGTNMRGHETILVVEDEPAVRVLVARTLRESGYRVLESGSGDEALRLASSERAIHLLLSDLVMPGMSGKELAAALLEQQPSTRVLFMSGYFDEKAGDIGAAAFIGKPFQRAELLAQVRALLDAPA